MLSITLAGNHCIKMMIYVYPNAFALSLRHLWVSRTLFCDFLFCRQILVVCSFLARFLVDAIFHLRLHQEKDLELI